jgi:hypothetical protein
MPNFAFDFGQCATFAPVSRNVSISRHRHECSAPATDAFRVRQPASNTESSKHPALSTRFPRRARPSANAPQPSRKTSLPPPTQPHASSTATFSARIPRSTRAAAHKLCTAHAAKHRRAVDRFRLSAKLLHLRFSFSKFSCSQTRVRSKRLLVNNPSQSDVAQRQHAHHAESLASPTHVIPARTASHAPHVAETRSHRRHALESRDRQLSQPRKEVSLLVFEITAHRGEFEMRVKC